MSIKEKLGDDPEILLADERYTLIGEIVQRSLKKGKLIDTLLQKVG